MNPVRLAARVLWADRRSRISAILTAIAVAVGTALVVFLTTLPDAAHARAQRSSWQTTLAQAGADSSATVVTLDSVAGQQITRIDIAGQLDPARIPPGTPRLPGPGQVVLSPALAALTQQLPPGQLAARFPGESAGVLGENHLRYPEQLVALVGHPPAALGGFGSTGKSVLAAGKAQAQDILLNFLSWVGIVLLALPSLVLVASASRLTAGRRERRLAALRLAGATPAQVVAAVAAEIGIAAAAGTAFGLVLGIPARYLAMRVPWCGGTWLASDFTPSAATLAAAGLGVPLLVVVAAVVGVRRVVRAPLDAALWHTRKRPRAWRLLVLAPVSVVFVLGLSVAKESGSIAVLLVALAAIVVSAAVVGPWVAGAVGAVFVWCWRRPATLLAGRRLRSDPKAAYRASSGIVLAVFTGSLALILLPGFESLSGGGGSFRDTVLYADVPAAQAVPAGQRVSGELARAGLKATPAVAHRGRLEDGRGRAYPALIMDCAQAAEVTRLALGSCQGPPGLHANETLRLSATGLRITSAEEPGTGQDASIPVADGVVVHPIREEDPDLAESVLVDPALATGLLPAGRSTIAVPSSTDNDSEKVRTALIRALPGAEVGSREQELGQQQVILTDLRRMTAIGLGIAALLAGCSAAITAAGSVVDRRRTFGALIAAGTPVTVLATALRTEAALPALVATVGAGAGGVAAGVGLLSVFHAEAAFTAWVLAPVVLGVAVAVIAASVCGPALGRASTEPLAEE